MKLTEKEVEMLVDLLRRQLLFQTATRIFKGIEIERVHVAIMWEPYCLLMELINKAGGFSPPKECRQALLAAHAEKARDVGTGKYDLKGWSAGELAMAIDEAKEVHQLATFAEACEAELKTRGN